jgi:hypothetical protein
MKYVKAFAMLSIKRLTHYVLLTPDERKSNFLLLLVGSTRRYLSQIKGYNKKKETLRSRKIAEKLRSDGFALVNLTEVDTGSLENICTNAIERLKRKRGYCVSGREFSESRESIKMSQEKDLYRLFRQAFNDAGIINAVSTYLRRECRLVEVSPQVNDVTDNFWRRDGGDDGERCSYLHYDAYGDHVKVIVYLNKVKEKDDGPFSYVRGSHIGVSRLMSLLGGVVDQSGLSGRDQSSRRLFSGLPECLQVKCAFGNDLSVDDVDAKEILRREETIYGDTLTAIVFDVRGFHRGGMVERGERRVCTSVIG